MARTKLEIAGFAVAVIGLGFTVVEFSNGPDILLMPGSSSNNPNTGSVTTTPPHPESEIAHSSDSALQPSSQSPPQTIVIRETITQTVLPERPSFLRNPDFQVGCSGNGASLNFRPVRGSDGTSHFLYLVNSGNETAEILMEDISGSEAFLETISSFPEKAQGVIGSTNYWLQLLQPRSEVIPCQAELVAVAWNDEEEPTLGSSAETVIDSMGFAYCYCETIEKDNRYIRFGAQYFTGLRTLTESYCKASQVCSDYMEQ